MQDLYAIPVRYNTRRFGYEDTQDVASSPRLQLSESSVAALYLVQHPGELQDTTFRARLRSAFRKIAALYSNAQVIKDSIGSVPASRCRRLRERWDQHVWTFSFPSPPRPVSSALPA